MTDPIEFCGALCPWYDRHKRALPFRETPDAYCVWVSEIMAQQTRIAALLPYYERFLEKFPTVCALARAPEEEVLRAWQGLGYYSRARNLQEAAKIVCDLYGGRLPEEASQLIKLPGIGRYTAGAIASIAYGQKEPAVDGNALRVYARLFADSTDVRQRAATEKAAKWIRECMEVAPPSVVTQAVMELGALVCVPGTTDCEHCPVAKHCEANRRHAQRAFPVRSANKPKKTENRFILLLTAGEYVLIHRRTERLLHNLWEFPGFSGEEEMCSQLSAWGVLPNEMPALLGTGRHIFTHLVWEMKIYACQTQQRPEIDGMVWADQNSIGSFAIPSAFASCLSLLMSRRKQEPGNRERKSDTL